MKLDRRIISLIFCLFLFLSLPVQAAANTKYIDHSLGAKEIISHEGDKLLLDKKWYDYKFEINPNTNSGGLPLQQVDRYEYDQALQQVTYSHAVNYKVYFLSYKLSNYPTAQALSFKDDSVVVFGTYYPLSQARIHQLAVHELGHQVDFKLMNQADWNKYLSLRNLTDSNLFNDSSSIYENRPQEIFAEDFRLLFGGEKAREIPHLNRSLPAPDTVRGLREFFLGLSSG